MKQFFQNLGYKMQRWMQGRYGTDELNRALSFGTIILLVASLIVGRATVNAETGRSSFVSTLLWYLAFAMLIWSLIRTYSKNLEKRRKEREAYMNFTGKIKGFFSLEKRKWSERKTHVYFKCPGCGKQLRVPKGKGNLRITCPGCGKVLEKKT